MQSKGGELPKGRNKREKILIIGGGATGSVIIRVLKLLMPRYEIICADKNPKRARMYLKGVKGIRIIKTNSSKNLYEQVKNTGILALVNAASSTMNEPYMELALKIGAYYFDLSSYNDHKDEHLKYRKRFIKKLLRGFFDFAVAPGLTNVIVAELVDDLDRVIVKIFVMEETKSSQTIYPWNCNLALDEARSRVPQFINWKYKKPIEPFSKWSWHKFSNLAKMVKCFAINENEAITLPEFLGNIKTLIVRCGGADVEALKIFVETNGDKHLTKDLYRLMSATPTSKELDILLKSGFVKNGRLRLDVQVEGMKEGKKVARRAWINFPTLKMFHKVLGANHVSGPSGIMAALGIVLLVECEFIDLVPPECLNATARKFIFSRLAKMGMPIHFEIR